MTQTTVIIPAWNAEATIARSIRSAAEQGDVEIMVADDASTDGTVAVARATGRAQVLTTPTNGGPSAARNRAIAAAKGTWLAVLDADDALVSGAIDRVVVLAGEIEADVMLMNLQRVGPRGNPVENRPFLDLDPESPPKPMTMSAFVTGNHGRPGERSLGYLKPLFRRKFLDDHSIRYDETLRNGEDTHLVLECLAAGARVFVSPQPDYIYTVRPGSISYRVDPAHLEALVVADDRFVDRHRARLSAEDHALFVTRRQALVRIRVTEEILQALKHRRPGMAIRRLWAHPAASGRLLYQLGEATMKRIRPKSRLVPHQTER